MIWLPIAIILIFIISIIWLWHFFSKGDVVGRRERLNIKIYEEQAHLLDNQLKDGEILMNDHSVFLQELQLELLQNKSDVKVYIKTRSIIFPILFSVCICVISVVLYLQIGNHNDWNKMIANENTDQVAMYKAREAAKVAQEDPTNIDKIVNFANALYDAGMYNETIKALDKANKINGDSAFILTFQARAQYYLDKKVITKQGQEYIDKAMILDANNTNLWMFLAEVAFMHGDYQKAIDNWMQIINNFDADKESINYAIEQAKSALEQGK